MPDIATATVTRDHEGNQIATGPITIPVWLTGLWLALFIIRPWEELIPELSSIRFERIYAVTVLSVVIASGLLRFRGHMQTYAVLLFLTVLAISTLMAYDTSLAWSELYKYVTLVVFYFVLLCVIRTPYELEFIIMCYVVTMAVYLGKAQWEYFVNDHHDFKMGVPRLLGIESTFGQSNSVASSTVVSLPFLQFLWWRRHETASFWPAIIRQWFPLFLIAYFGLAVTSIMLTNSRSGAVSFTVFVVLFGKLKPQSRKKIKSTIVTVLALAVLWIFVPETTKSRISTLWDPDSGPASAKSSADGRKESFLAGLEMFSRSPITGVGIGNTALYRGTFLDGKFVSPHNFYGEVLGETGVIGAAAFLLLVSCLYANIRATRALAERCVNPTTAMLSDLARACSYVIILLLVSGLAGDGMLRFQWLWLAAFALLARTLCESIAKDEEDRHFLIDAQVLKTAQPVPPRCL